MAFTTAAAGCTARVVHRLDGVPLRCASCSRRRARATRTCSRRSPGGSHDAAHRRGGCRPGQRRGRRRTRRLPPRRQGGRRPARRRSADRRARHGRSAGRVHHAHIALPAVNAARRLSPRSTERTPSSGPTSCARGRWPVPSTFVTGYRYALLGYTTVVEAATPPLAARHVLAELRDTPMIDAAFLLLMDNTGAVDLIRRDPARVRDAVAWWLEATGGYGVKLVNPGGVERWKRGEGNVSSLDDDVAGVTPGRCWKRSAARRTTSSSPSRPRPLQQPRRRRQLEDDPRHAAHAGGSARASRAPAVPRLRRQARRAAALPRAGPRRVPGRPSRVQRRRRAGDVRGRDDDDRRRAGVRAAAGHHGRQVGERRHGGRDGLRDRAVHLQGKELRARAPVGDRARAVPPQPRPVAAGALHRSPERRLVPQLPAADPPADGPRLPQRAAAQGEQEGHPAHRAARRPRSRVLARGDRDHHARRARAAAGPARQGPPGRRRQRRRDALRRPRRPRGDVRHAALRDQGRPRGGARRRARRGARGRPAARHGAARPRRRGRPAGSLRGALHGAVRQLSGERAVAARARPARRCGADA